MDFYCNDSCSYMHARTRTLHFSGGLVQQLKKDVLGLCKTYWTMHLLSSGQNFVNFASSDKRNSIWYLKTQRFIFERHTVWVRIVSARFKAKALSICYKKTLFINESRTSAAMSQFIGTSLKVLQWHSGQEITRMQV